MKLIFFWFFIFAKAISAQSPTDLQWVQNFGSGNYDHVSGIYWDNEHHLYVSGYFSGSLNGQTSNGGTDAYLAKYDNNGSLIWLRIFGGTEEDRVHQLSYDNAAGRILLSGYFMGKMYYGNDSLSTIDREDIFVISIDSSGNYQWGKSFGGPGSQSSSSIAVDKEHNISLSGYFEDTLQADGLQLVSRGIRNAFLLQLDSSGTCNWGYRMGGLLYDEGLNIAYDNENNIYLSGYYRDTADFGPFAARSVFTYDCFLVSLSQSGNWRWLRSFGGGYIDNCPAIAYMPKSGNVLVGGWFFGDIRFGSDTLLVAQGEEESFLAAFDTLGQLQWSRRFGDNFAELLYDLSVDSEDNILAVGTFDSIIHLGQDTFIAKHYNKPTDLFVFGFTPEGKYSWGYKAGAEFNDFGFHCAWGDSSTFYISGNFLNKSIFSSDTIFSNGNYDVYLAKMYLDTTLIRPNSVPALSESDFLLRVFPNPADDFINIEFDDLTDFGYDLQLFDIYGRMILQKNISEKIAVLHLRELEKGHYFIRVSDGRKERVVGVTRQ